MDSPVSRAPPPKNSPAQGRSQVSLTPRQQHQLADLFIIEEHAALEVTWRIYQNIVDACRTPDTSLGKALMRAEINTRTSTRVPSCPTELMTLGRTLKRRAGDILSYFDHPTPATVPPKPSTDGSNIYADPHSDLRNLTNYIAQTLLETGRFRPQLHPQLEKPHLCTFAPTAGSTTICGWSLNRTYVHLECASL